MIDPAAAGNGRGNLSRDLSDDVCGTQFLPGAVGARSGRPDHRCRHARNLKSATAAQVRIQGELQVGGQVVEKRSARLDYLPGFSRRDGGLFFGRDPRQGKLILRAESYQEP